VGKSTSKKKSAGGGRPRRSRAAGHAEAPTATVAPAAPGAAPVTAASAAPAGGAPVTLAASVAANAPAASGALVLGASLSIREVGECAAQFKAMFAAGSAEVDARMLESVDTAGLQLLLAAAAAARRRGLTLKLLGAERLNAGPANALGLTDHLAAAAEIQP
jgi:anti-anti-sigma regulatory factor